MKDLKYYLDLPYTKILRRDEEGEFVARIDELPGCVAHGKNEGEALERLKEVQALWITDSIESGDTVPEPEETLPSGKWVQRVPRSLHRKLVSFAKREGVSLNQLVSTILSEAVGVRKAREIEARPTEEPFELLYAGERTLAGTIWSRAWGTTAGWTYVGKGSPFESAYDALSSLAANIPNKATIEREHDYEKEAKAHKIKAR